MMARVILQSAILTYIIIAIWHLNGYSQNSIFKHDSIRQKCDSLRQQHVYELGYGGAYTIYGVINQKAQIGGPVLLCTGPLEEINIIRRGENTIVYFVPHNAYVDNFDNLKDTYKVLASSPSCFTIRLFDTFASKVPDGVAADLQYYSSITGGMAELTFVPDIEPGLYVLVCIVNDGRGTRMLPNKMSDVANYMLTVEGSVLQMNANVHHSGGTSINDINASAKTELETTTKESPSTLSFVVTALTCISFIVLIIGAFLLIRHRVVRVK